MKNVPAVSYQDKESFDIDVIYSVLLAMKSYLKACVIVCEGSFVLSNKINCKDY